MTDFNSYKIVNSISDIHRVKSSFLQASKPVEKDSYFTLWYELATWNSPECMPISTKATVLDFLSLILQKHNLEFSSFLSLSDLTVSYDGVSLPQDVAIYTLITPSLTHPITVSWSSAFRLLWEDEVLKTYQKVTRKHKLFSFFPKIYDSALSSLSKVSTVSALKSIDLIRQTGGLNRYVFRNEKRVGDIIKEILIKSIEILPFFKDLEVVEGLDVRMGSEDKEKKRMRVDYAIVVKEGRTVGKAKKKEEVKEGDEKEAFEETKVEEVKKEGKKWRNRKVCLVVSKNKRLIGEIIKKHIQTLRYWWWAESGVIGKDGIKQKRMDKEIRFSGEIKSDIFGIWTDLKEWHFTYYSRKRELDPYLRRDWFAISESIKLYESYFITESELKKLMSYIRAFLIHIAYPTKEIDVIDDIQEIERPDFSFISQRKEKEVAKNSANHVDLSKVL